MAEQQPAQQRQQAQPPAAPVPMPYVPTPDEETYLEECAKAIMAGSDAAATAAAAGNGGEFQSFANGVKALTDAYEAIKTGGRPSRHQGA